MTEMMDSTPLTEKDIIHYLRHHPHFFEEHPNLLKKLHLKHDSGEAISLMERQNLILRKENSDLIDRLNHFIQMAQRNDRLFLKLQTLIIELLACKSLNAIVCRLQSILTENFDVDAVQLVLSHRLLTDGDLWLYCDKDTLAEQFPACINEARNECGEYTATTRELLFAERQINSLALGALTHKGTPVGVIALGSCDPEHFRSGTETLFLGHLAKVLSQLLETY
jgi:uncharacterized protein YigA (DUF484 family)